MNANDIQLILTNEEGEPIGFSSGDSSLVCFALSGAENLQKAYFCIGNEKSEMKFDGGSFKYILDCRKNGIGLIHFHIEYVLDDKTNYLLSDGTFSYTSDKYISGGDFTFLIYDSGYKTPDFIKGGVIYQIFPDRFFRSGKVEFNKKNAIFDGDWENGLPEYGKNKGDGIKNNRFFGGDLYGVAEKLNYLLSLGVSCIYLTPVFKASSNHRYDTGDYNTVDELLGGDKAFDYLISECKAKGISVILDGVFNHTGDDSVYFNKYGNYESCGAYQSENSEYRKWYNFDGKYKSGYESWWGISTLPRVRCDEPSYREFICGKNGVLKKYLNSGISGWRLDVADELSDSFIENIRQSIKEENPEAMLYGEVWEDASCKVSYGCTRQYLEGKELDSVMNYPLKDSIIGYLISGNSAIIERTMKMLSEKYPKPSLDTLMNFLGTHDTERILTALASSPCRDMPNDYKATVKLTVEERSLSKKRLTLAVCLIMTLPGVPCIYYGDEAGMEGYGDPFNRMPYPWGNEDDEVVGTYRRFAAARLSCNVYKEGVFSALESEQGVFAFERKNKDESVITAVNAGGSFFTLALPYPCVSLLTGAEYKSDTLLLPMTCDILKRI